MKTTTVIIGVTAATLLASVTAVDAQGPCQSTIMNPCPPPQPRPDNSATSSKSDSNKSDQSKNERRRGLLCCPGHHTWAWSPRARSDRQILNGPPLPSVIGGPGGWLGFMGRTDTCVSKPAVPLGEGLHRVAVAHKN